MRRVSVDVKTTKRFTGGGGGDGDGDDDDDDDAILLWSSC